MPLNIAIDGPVGAGKSTIAHEVARRLGILHLDTGAMYRAVGYTALKRGISVENEQALGDLLTQVEISVIYRDGAQQTLVDGTDVSGLIRSPEVGMAASAVSRWSQVRKHMVALQRRLAEQCPMVLDGRDIGTNVLPHANVKIFLTATPEERAHRRHEELLSKRVESSYQQVLSDLIQRDHQDSTRPVDPLRPAEDAVLLDSTSLTTGQVVERILQIVEEHHESANA